jgi:hypothetical protein
MNNLRTIDGVQWELEQPLYQLKFDGSKVEVETLDTKGWERMCNSDELRTNVRAHFASAAAAWKRGIELLNHKIADIDANRLAAWREYLKHA